MAKLSGTLFLIIMPFSELLHFAVKIHPEKVYFLKFILEGYDNLFLASTLDPTEGVVLIRAVYGSEDMLIAVLESTASTVGLQCVERV